MGGFKIKKTIGVLGGMGPQATADFFQKIINFTDANCDQEHIPLIIDNNTQVPDRTDYILNNGENPLQELIPSAVKLEQSGADCLVMICNTAHYFYDEIVKYLEIPFLNMIEEVALEIKQEYKEDKVGLLATTGTYQSGIYKKMLAEHDIELIEPSKGGKELVYNAIYKIKEDNVGRTDIKRINNKVLKKMKEDGISTVILGCTELPLVVEQFHPNINYIGSTDVLAKRAVEYAKEG